MSVSDCALFPPSPSREKGEGEGNEMECVTEPTLQDYEAKIRHLQQEKEQKAHEVVWSTC